MHDEHFLHRLERLDDQEVSDALALYQDPELVRELLGYARERGHDDRVAISLDDPREGPFIIVTQRGDFVTALGRGMGCGDLLVVPRAAWDAMRRTHLTFRDAWKRASETSRGRFAALGREMYDGGPYVSRELMSDMLSIGRLLEQQFTAAWSRTMVDVSVALRTVKSRASYRELDADFFANTDRLMWLLGHYSLIVSVGGMKKLGSEDPRRSHLAQLRPGLYATRLGLVGPFLRTMMLVGKFGPVFLKTLKVGLREAPDRVYALDAAMGLAAIATRFSKYRGEVKKALTLAEPPDASPEQLTRCAYGALAAATLVGDLPADAPRQFLRQIGELHWQRLQTTLPPGHGLHFERPEDIPDDLCLPAVASIDGDLWTAVGHLDFMAMMVPGVCALEPEELYFPRAALEYVPRYRFGPAAQGAFERLRAYTVEAYAPPPVPATPGRNEPCPCGSGKKYKRCCGA